MKKIEIFNYFVKKALSEEKELLNTEDDRVAMMALAFAKFDVQHQHATGCSLEKGYLVNTEFVKQLFVLVCLEAKEYGDGRLAQLFSFKPKMHFNYGSVSTDVYDADVEKHLNEVLYPIDSVDKHLYQALLPKGNPQEVEQTCMKKASEFSRKPNPKALETTEPCAETEIIDRTWNRLRLNKDFVSLLDPRGKVNNRGDSIIYHFYKDRLSAL